MKNFKRLVSGFLILTSLTGSAKEGDRGGNGGDGIICRDANGRVHKAELLDYYEGKVLRGITPDRLSDSLSFEENLNILLLSLERLSPNRSKLYRDWMKNFFDEALMLKGQKLEDIPDSGHLTVPKGCEIEQVVIQTVPKYKEDKRYLIDSDLWAVLPNSSKAGLVFHELLLRESIETSYGDIDTRDLRYLNSLIASKSSAGMDQKGLNELIRSFAFFSYIEILGLDSLLHQSLLHNETPVLKFGLYKDNRTQAFYPRTTTVNFNGVEIQDKREDFYFYIRASAEGFEIVSRGYDYEHSFENGKHQIVSLDEKSSHRFMRLSVTEKSQILGLSKRRKDYIDLNRYGFSESPSECLKVKSENELKIQLSPSGMIEALGTEENKGSFLSCGRSFKQTGFSAHGEPLEKGEIPVIYRYKQSPFCLKNFDLEAFKKSGKKVAEADGLFGICHESSTRTDIPLKEGSEVSAGWTANRGSGYDTLTFLPVVEFRHNYYEKFNQKSDAYKRSRRPLTLIMKSGSELVTLY